MKVWARGVIEQSCNLCGRRMQRGDLRLELHIEGVTRVARRCENCAGETAPTDLPAVTKRSVFPPLDMSRLSAKLLPPDFKMAQAGREPGDED